MNDLPHFSFQLMFLKNQRGPFKNVVLYPALQIKQYFLFFYCRPMCTSEDSQQIKKCYMSMEESMIVFNPVCAESTFVSHVIVLTP